MKTLKGTVVSANSQKTAVVVVESTWQHPLYNKTIRKSKKYLVHNEKGAGAGDTVFLQETRPLSKRKRWIITKVIK